MRILICETDHLFLSLLKESLTDSGHEVCGTAEKSDEALLLAAELRLEAAIVSPSLRDGDTGLAPVAELADLDVPSVLIAKSMSVVPTETAARAILRMPFGLDDLVDALANLNRPEE